MDHNLLCNIKVLDIRWDFTRLCVQYGSYLGPEFTGPHLYYMTLLGPVLDKSVEEKFTFSCFMSFFLGTSSLTLSSPKGSPESDFFKGFT